MKYILQDSLRVIPSALVDVSVKSGKVYECFQFERLGFFSVDKDTTSDKVMLCNYSRTSMARTP